MERWKRTDVYGFNKRLALAEREYLEKLEAEADRRGVEGVDHPVIHKGIITDTYKQYSDNLLMFRMKRLQPEYRENYSTPNKDQQVAVTKIIINLAPGVEPPPGALDGQTSYREAPPATEGEYREISEGDKS